MAAARRTGGRLKRRPIAGPTNSVAPSERTKAIREWASERGIELAKRGRIPAHVITAYDEAQAEEAQPKLRGSRRKAKEEATG